MLREELGIISEHMPFIIDGVARAKNRLFDYILEPVPSREFERWYIERAYRKLELELAVESSFKNLMFEFSFLGSELGSLITQRDTDRQDREFDRAYEKALKLLQDVESSEK